MRLEFRKEDWEEFLGNIDFTDNGISTPNILDNFSISVFNCSCRAIEEVDIKNPLKLSLSLLAYNKGTK